MNCTSTDPTTRRTVHHPTSGGVHSTSHARSAKGSPVPHAGRRRLRHQGPARHASSQAARARVVRSADEIEIVGLGETRNTSSRALRCSQKTLDTGEAGENVVASPRASSARHRARPGAREAGLDHAAQEFDAEVYVLSKDEGGAAHAVPAGLPPASSTSAPPTSRAPSACRGASRWVDAGRQREDDGRNCHARRRSRTGLRSLSASGPHGGRSAVTKIIE